MRLPRDTLAGLLGLALSVWLFALTAGLPKSSFVPIGPDFYPRIVLAATALLSVAVAVEGVRGRRPRLPGAAPRRNLRLVLLTFLVFGLYVALLPLLGFRAATLAFLLALQVVLDPPADRRRWVTVALVAVVTTAVAYFAFERYLSVLLPRGSLTGF
ncbi:MAG: tripartite tricarboxylate transporter TctB family protein [Alphaproteobacteria bacterium]|nr:tripartite tricarboxylate transporter TctB family protein [Alphaproteobacteria bacterium]